jgi:simple sugar transport system permease protein
MNFESNAKHVFKWISVGLLAFAIVMAIVSAILIIAGAQPWAAYYHLLRGSVGSWIKVSHVLKAWIPLTLCACGLIFSFRINLWNIGIEGQMMMGAVLATAVLQAAPSTSESGAAWIGLSLVGGAVGGALWALLAGVLKTKGGVNEIFAGLGLNFVAQGLILWLIFGPWKRPGVASMSGTETLTDSLWLPVWPALRLAPISLMMALGAILLTFLILRYTPLGLTLKAVGKNAQAAYLMGLKPNRQMLWALLLAGGFAGLAGNLQITSVYHRLIPAISSNYGYLALLCVMLANYSLWRAPLVAFFFACLNVGSIQLPMALELDSSLSGVIQGALVLTLLGFNAWRTRHASPQATTN